MANLPTRPGVREPDDDLLGPLIIVYVVWGSTYLAQKVGLEGMPPLTAERDPFLSPGRLPVRVLPRAPDADPTGAEWRAGAIQGLLLPAAGTGGAAWAEQWLPSGDHRAVPGDDSAVDVLGRRLGGSGDRTAGRGPGLVAGIAGVAMLARPAVAATRSRSRSRSPGRSAGGSAPVYAVHAPRPSARR